MFWRAQRRPPPAPIRDIGPAAALGRRVGGEAALPVRDGRTVVPLAKLVRHVLVLGASGFGKTETLLKLAYGVATESDWRISYLDGKGSDNTLARFYSLMRLAGRDPRVFPNHRYDGWRGDSVDIANRLVEVIDYPDTGPAAYYRDLAVNIVRLCCDAPGGPPRSSTELLARMHLPELASLHDGHPARALLAGYTERQLTEARARYQAFFGGARGRLDGTWAFEDADSAYLKLDGMRLKHDAGNLARYLVEDFIQYAVARKPAGTHALLIVDEFSALERAGSQIVGAVERLREAGVAVVLAPQVLEGMGGPEAAARIGGSTNIRLVHQMPNPDEVVKVAGTRLVPQISFEHEDGVATGRTSTRMAHTYKVDPNDVRQLPVGTCFAICEGRAAKVRVERAPDAPAVGLPPPESDSPPPTAPETAAVTPIRP
jgi:hypothetical protein